METASAITKTDFNIKIAILTRAIAGMEAAIVTQAAIATSPVIPRRAVIKVKAVIVMEAVTAISKNLGGASSNSRSGGDGQAGRHQHHHQHPEPIDEILHFNQRHGRRRSCDW